MQEGCVHGQLTLLENRSQKGRVMPKLSRRAFMASAVAAGSVKAIPVLTKPPARRVLTLVYDKSLGLMRAIDRVVR